MNTKNNESPATGSTGGETPVQKKTRRAAHADHLKELQKLPLVALPPESKDWTLAPIPANDLEISDFYHL